MILLSSLAFAQAPPPTWNDTIDRVLDSVVILHMDRTRPFDGNRQSSSQASGFVIDAERGLILTNRHVVTTGPTVAQAIFDSKEEVDLVPLYRDPVHDFGLFQYDPADLQHIRPVSLELAPDAAEVGREIRVIGNDAAEQISILAGTLSRLDRDAPYWDFNTFYLQAASSTSGGSSGSPVFDREGRVVALNAGARNDAATSLFLPLERVVYAVEALKRGEVPARGTVQAVLGYQTFDQLERLGLDGDTEARVRAEWDGTGMLTVARVNDGGPADGVLEEGDILLEVGGEPIYGFVRWEAAVDAAVGGRLGMAVLRGGERVEVEIEVEDLHALTPSAYFEIGEGVLHDLGYHGAVRVPRPVQGVAVARSGRLFASAGIARGSVIEGIGDTEVRRLDDAIEALSAVPDGQRVQIRTSEAGNPKRKRVVSLLMNRAFWPVRRCERDARGDWPCVDAAVPEPIAETERYRVTLPEVRRRKLAAAAQALVTVRFRPQLNLDSIHGNQRESPGVVIDRTRGWILTDRNVAPVTTGEIRVQWGDAPSVPGTLEYLDPQLNVAIVRVDPARWELPEGGPPELVAEPVSPGDALHLVALDKEGRIYEQELDIERVMPASFSDPAYPRWMARDVDFLRVGSLDRPTLGGVLCDRKGRVVALLQRYERDEGNRYKTSLYASSVRYALKGLDRFRSGVTEVPDLGLDVHPISLVDAREAGLPEALAERIRRHAPERPTVLEVVKIAGDSPAANVLKAGDWIVRARGRTVTTFDDLRGAVRSLQPLPLEIVRRNTLREVAVTPRALPVEGTDRVLLWAGALVQEEPPAVALYSQTPPAGVYLSWYYGGSPAQRYDTGYGRRILEVDGVPIADLDGFVAAVRGRADRSSVRLRMQGLRGEEWVGTLKLDTRYWPTQEFVRVDGRWERRELD